MCAEVIASGRLDAAEHKFIRDICKFGAISPKQQAWLDRIVARVRKERAA